MNEELNSLKSKETFELVEEIPSKCSIIKSKWVFKLKVNPDQTT